MKKSDLKNRMVVECRNGNKYMVIDDMLLSTTGFMRLSDYKKDLTLNSVFFDGFDIMKVYKEINNFDFDIANNIIWERRSKVKKVTMSEIEEIFGCKVKIINK